METLIEKLDYWKKIKQTSFKEKSEIFYWKEIFPEILQKAMKKSMKFHKKYDCLISLVGFAPPPLILTIKILEPEFILFLYTKDTKTQLDIIKAHTGLRLSDFDYIEVSGSQSEEVYDKVKQCIAKYPDKNIAIDITGGKKSMVGGAAIAGALTGCDIFYVDFEKYDEELRQPIPGSEYLNFISNPFEIFGDLDLEKGKRLFNEGNFYASSQIFLDLLNKLPHNEEAVFLYELSILFKDWDEYSFASALKYCRSVIKHARRCQIYLEFLEKLLEKEQILQKLTDGDALTINLNHYFTSTRMAKRKRYDFATLLLYRTLEMAFATQLFKKYKFDVNEPEYSLIDNIDVIEEKFYQAGKSIYGKKYQKESLPTILAFMNAYQLLYALTDPMIHGENPNKVKGIAFIRNKSVVAHGTNCITEEQYQDIHKCFIPFLQYFVATYFNDKKIEDFNEQYNFFEL